MQVEIITLIVSSGVAALVSAFITGLYARVKAGTKDQIEMQKAFQQGMRALLWSEIKQRYDEAIKQGGMTTEDRKHLESVYIAYHTLGGNGTGERLYKDAMNLSVLDKIIKKV